ncbi:MAG TPA: hypothetical protein PLA16_05845 [Chitinophagales bacterium]|nr:hypothetical protein [Chitinophagales bacterium]
MSNVIEVEKFPHPAEMYARVASTFLKKGKGEMPDLSIHLPKASLSPAELK